MTNKALEIETREIDYFAAYDAIIQIDWIIGTGGHMEKRKIGFVGFYQSYDYEETDFRKHVFNAYDAIKVAYENWPDGEIQTSITFFETDVNM